MNNNIYKEYIKNGFCKVEQILSNDKVDNIVNTIIRIAVIVAKENNILIESMDKEYILNELIPKIYTTNKELGSVIYNVMNKHVNTYNFFNDCKIHEIIKVALNKNDAELICDNFQFFIHIPNNDEHILGWHQDSSYFKQFNHDKSLVCWIPLIDVGIEDGAIWAIPGSHKKGMLKHIENIPGKHKNTDWDKKGLSYLDNKEFNDNEALQIEINKGDIALFDFNLIHKSGLTRGNKVRYTILARFSRAF